MEVKEPFRAFAQVWAAEGMDCYPTGLINTLLKTAWTVRVTPLLQTGVILLNVPVLLSSDTFGSGLRRRSAVFISTHL